MMMEPQITETDSPPVKSSCCLFWARSEKFAHNRVLPAARVSDGDGAVIASDSAQGDILGSTEKMVGQLPGAVNMEVADAEAEVRRDQGNDREYRRIGQGDENRRGQGDDKNADMVHKKQEHPRVCALKAEGTLQKENCQPSQGEPSGEACVAAKLLVQHSDMPWQAEPSTSRAGTPHKVALEGVAKKSAASLSKSPRTVDRYFSVLSPNMGAAGRNHPPVIPPELEGEIKRIAREWLDPSLADPCIGCSILKGVVAQLEKYVGGAEGRIKEAKIKAVQLEEELQGCSQRVALLEREVEAKAQQNARLTMLLECHQSHTKSLEDRQLSQTLTSPRVICQEMKPAASALAPCIQATTQTPESSEVAPSPSKEGKLTSQRGASGLSNNEIVQEPTGTLDEAKGILLESCSLPQPLADEASEDAAKDKVKCERAAQEVEAQQGGAGPAGAGVDTPVLRSDAEGVLEEQATSETLKDTLDSPEVLQLSQASEVEYPEMRETKEVSASQALAQETLSDASGLLPIANPVADVSAKGGSQSVGAVGPDLLPYFDNEVVSKERDQNLNPQVPNQAPSPFPGPPCLPPHRPPLPPRSTTPGTADSASVSATPETSRSSTPRSDTSKHPRPASKPKPAEKKEVGSSPLRRSPSPSGMGVDRGVKGEKGTSVRVATISLADLQKGASGSGAQPAPPQKPKPDLNRPPFHRVLKPVP